MDIRKKIGSEFIFLDSAMGTMLQKNGLKPGEIPESYNIEKPEIVSEIHRLNIKAGADILTANTFGANSYKLKNTSYSVQNIVKKGIELAKVEADEQIVALDVGPIGQALYPIGDLEFEEAYNIFKESMIAGESAGADIVIIETISDLREMKAAILAAKENTDLPVFATMTFSDNGRTLSGTSPSIMGEVLSGLGVDALGFNCSLGPDDMIDLLKEMREYTELPIIVQPNAGIPYLEGSKTLFPMNSQEFAEHMATLAEEGASILGGCCGTTSEYITKIKEKVKGKALKQYSLNSFTNVCSGSRIVQIDEELKVVGERINPTGRQDMKEEIKQGKLDIILKEANVQAENGADILDVNVGVPKTDEINTMIRSIKEIQKITDTPIQIDSVDPKVIEGALRIYNGKPIINSINGEYDSLHTILPLAKKYGANVIGLTLDENGIPNTVKGKLEIAERIVNTAKEYGIDRRNIIIDCLVLTATSEESNIHKTLEAMETIKRKLNVKLVLGVSNVSFGLPNRALLNRSLLLLAMKSGLNLAIVDPLDEDMKDSIYAYNTLMGEKIEVNNYVERFGNRKKSEVNVKEKANQRKENNEDNDLERVILNGIEEEVISYTKDILNRKPAMRVIEEDFIPILDIIGDKYDAGEIFLPELLHCAKLVSKAFKLVKEKLGEEQSENISKGKIIIATVEGDIHDIGKNIVKILLENYGYDVIDLGVDVSTDKILQSVEENEVKLVGLSALMTTTVQSMEKSIKAIKEKYPECITMVGGAVLTEDMAESIGADYYGADGNDSVNIAKKVFNK